MAPTGKQHKTSVFEFPYLCVTLSLEEPMKIKVIIYSETRNV